MFKNALWKDLSQQLGLAHFITIVNDRSYTLIRIYFKFSNLTIILYILEFSCIKPRWKIKMEMYLCRKCERRVSGCISMCIYRPRKTTERVRLRLAIKFMRDQWVSPVFLPNSYNFASFTIVAICFYWSCDSSFLPTFIDRPCSK